MPPAAVDLPHLSLQNPNSSLGLVQVHLIA